MDLDFLGIEYGLTVLQGAAPVYEWEVLRGEVAMDVAGVTFGGEVAGVGDIVVEHVSGEQGVLRVHLPRLDAVGEFGYEVWCVAEGGERYRLVYGVVGVVESSALFAELEGLEVSHTRMALRMPECVGGHVQLVWRSVAGGAAATREAVEAAGEAVNAAREAVDALVAARAFMASFEEAVSKAVRVGEDGVLVIGNYYTGVRVKGEDGVTPYIGANGNWWSGERDLGKPSRGEDGVTPSISHDGYWVLGDWKSDVQARGRDGIDGTAVRRILVENVSELPSEGETCNGGFYYYVPNEAGEYDVYAWLESKSGKGWVRVTMAYDIATSEVYGLNKLGTDIVHEKGAVVGVNGDGRMTVPPASAAEYGAFMASSTKVEKQGGAPIYKGEDGKFYVNMATTNKPGGVIYSAWGATPDNYCIGPNTSGWIDVMNAGEYQRGVVLRAAGLADVRDGAVPEAKQVKRYLDSNFLTVEETWTREQVKEHVSGVLVDYCRKEDALVAEDLRKALVEYDDREAVSGRVKEALSEAKGYVDTELSGYDSREVAEGRFVQCAGVRGMEVVTLDELPAPAEQQKGVLYIAVL